ncbi:MAG: type II toxin-antitoxin system prevent-host-death family antitoxin [Actinomycetota bacterium]|nr:type II toxin-antitoxin system prevent-host-death family antitoxin [Actinomycetota bacterium]
MDLDVFLSECPLRTHIRRQIVVENLGVTEAKKRFSELISRVAAGERFVILRRGKPAVAIVPADPRLASDSRPSSKRFMWSSSKLRLSRTGWQTELRKGGGKASLPC